LLFVDPFFLFVLLPAAVCASYITRLYAGLTAALAVVVVASAIFYAPYGALPAALLATSLSLNFIIGISLSKESDGEQGGRNTLLAVGLVVNFAALATFKYLDQLAALVAPSTGPILGIAIPAGISFYTFHQAVFLLHAYNRQVEVMSFLKGARSIPGKLAAFIRYGAFVAFFPQLIIGPITYMSEFAPQLQSGGFGRPRIDNIQVGVTLVVIGLFKKLCIADTLAGVVNRIYAETAAGIPISPRHAVLAIIGYFFQLYFDFSGYSDIALGIARLFGLRLPINFDSPLRATGIVDFYRRWHITLTRVIGVFVFTPLSLWGTRTALERGYKGWRRRALGAWLPFLGTFQVIALWHAAKYTFIIFGVVHALWYILETEARTSDVFKAYRTRTSDRLRLIAGMAITVVPLMLTFALFRSESLTAFWNLLSALIVAAPTPPVDEYIKRREWLEIAVIAAIVYLFPNIYEVLKPYRPGIAIFDNEPTTVPIFQVTWRPTLIWGLIVSVLAALVFPILIFRRRFSMRGFERWVF
jgi:alginate O-acetyltransferase complex protein AlgI